MEKDQTPGRPSRKEASRRLAFAADFPLLNDAVEFMMRTRLGECVSTVKVGLELFTSSGPRSVGVFRDEIGCDVFLDLKLHDIPETVDRAVGAACQLGARFLTVHAGGGQRMMEAAASRAVKERSGIQLLAVTVLTSLDASDLSRIGFRAGPRELVVEMAKLARESGVNGFVCSASEVSFLRRNVPDSVIVTPGIRPAGTDVGDQKRIATPSSAIRDGASMLVVGRPIRDAEDPRAAAESVLDEIVNSV